MAGSSQTGDILREIASEHGFEADDEGTAVIDHLNFDVNDEGKHTLVVADPENLIKSKHIVGQAAAAEPLLYQVRHHYRQQMIGIKHNSNLPLSYQFVTI